MEKKENIAFNINNMCKGIQGLKMLIEHVEANSWSNPSWQPSPT